MSPRLLTFTRFLVSQCGLSTFAARADGSKAPAAEVLPRVFDKERGEYVRSWAPYQERLPSDDELVRMFGGPMEWAIAVACGGVSGNLEVIDCDEIEVAKIYLELVNAHNPNLYERLAIIETGSGCNHVPICSDKVSGNLKLAMREIFKEVSPDTKGAKQGEDGKWYKRALKTLIETRGQGGYIIFPGSPLSTHSSGRPYRFIEGDPQSIPFVTPAERALLFSLAIALNEVKEETVKRHYKASKPRDDGSLRPGDDFDARGDVLEVLLNYGWSVDHTRGRIAYLRKPGKTGRNHQATLGAVAPGVFYCFSTSAAPFEDRRGYSPFKVYALLEHGGDYKAAARALSRQGFGSKKGKTKVISTPKLEPVRKPEGTILLSPPKRPENTILLPAPSRPAATILLNAEVAR